MNYQNWENVDWNNIYQEKITWLIDYYPTTHPSFKTDRNSHNILNFKNGDGNAVAMFYSLLMNFLEKNFSYGDSFKLATVPCSKPGLEKDGFFDLFTRLKNNQYKFKILNQGKNILMRYKEIPKQTSTKNRTIIQHLESLSTCNVQQGDW